MVAVNAHDSEVKFCPGDRTHFELLQREGFRDAICYHAGPYAPGTERHWNFYACVGAGRVALPKRCARVGGGGGGRGLGVCVGCGRLMAWAG